MSSTGDTFRLELRRSCSFFSAKFAAQRRSNHLPGLIAPHVAPYNSFSILGPKSAQVRPGAFFASNCWQACSTVSTRIDATKYVSVFEDWAVVIFAQTEPLRSHES